MFTTDINLLQTDQDNHKLRLCSFQFLMSVLSNYYELQRISNVTFSHTKKLSLLKYKLLHYNDSTHLIDEPRLWILQTSDGRIRDTKGTANTAIIFITIQH